MSGLVLVVVAVLASQSRGGAIALAVAAAAAAAIHWRGGSLTKERLLPVAALAVLAIGGVAVFESGRVSERLGELVSGELDQLDADEARRSIWQANFDAFQSRPWLGYGAGVHRDVYPLFLEKPFSKEFTHAESGYLQIASESGAAGLALLAAAWVLCVGWIAKATAPSARRETAALGAAIMPGLAASVVHSVFDFVWFVPSLVAVTLMLAAAAMRLATLESSPTPAAADRSRSADGSFGSFARLSLVACAVAWSLGVVIGSGRGAAAWDRYLRCSSHLGDLSQQLIRATNTRSEDDPLPGVYRHQTEYSVALLERVVAADLDNARAHLRLAGRLLQLFELQTAVADNPMPIEMVRDAAIQSRFATPTEMQAWLRRAIGDRVDLLLRAKRHAEVAVSLGPLQGDGYLYLANLAFLDNRGNEAVGELVEQALRVRPHDGGVLYEAGRQLYLLGRRDEATACWRDCLARHGSHRDKLVSLLARTTPADAFLSEYEPDRVTIDLALAHYVRYGREEDLAAFCRYASDAAEAARIAGDESPVLLARRWRQLSELLRSIDRADEAAGYALRAYEQLPHDFAVRFEAGFALHAAERYDEADPHLRWCLARRPDLQILHGMLASAVKLQRPVMQSRLERLRGAESLSTNPAGAAIPAALRRLTSPAPEAPRTADASAPIDLR